MQTIRELLDRIRWDADFGRAAFRIGFWDRLERRVVEVPFRLLSFPPDDHSTFELTDDGGRVHTVPLHRVCAVYRDGERIWHRPRCDGALSRRRRR